MMAVNRGLRSSIVLIGPLETDEHKALVIRTIGPLFGMSGFEGMPMSFVDKWNVVNEDEVEIIPIQKLINDAHSNIDVLLEAISKGEGIGFMIKFMTEAGKDHEPTEEEREEGLSNAQTVVEQRRELVTQLETIYRQAGLIE
jgi:hypothetical protein